ncbi:hypothetical protein ACLMJK_006306 [Lecanora helva]
MSFIFSQLFVKIPYPKADHSGQTIIVTGANVGLGLEASRHFVRLNAAKVILAVRNLEKGEKAKESIEESTKRPGVTEVWQLDLSSYESTKQFARRAQGLNRLDALVENAGIATAKYSTTEDNESTITTNVVSTFLLAIMLLPKLRESGNKFNSTPHLTVVSSEVHGWVDFPERNSPDIFKVLNDRETANMETRYQTSKLLEVFIVRELAARARERSKGKVIMNLANPGLCHSELARDAGYFLYFLKLFLARTSEHGSRSMVNAAADGPDTDGQYLSDGRITEPAPLVRSEEGVKAQKQIWDELFQKLEKIQPGVMSNV